MSDQTTLRRGYSLLEILLSLALAMLLLAAVYVSISTQFTLASASRNLVERTTLARAVFARMSTDISSTTTLCDPGRYRRDVDAASGASTLSSEPTTGTGGTTGTGMGTATGSGTGTGTGTTETPDMGSTETPETMDPSVTLVSPVVLPIGLVGDSTTLHLMVTRLPKETWRVPLLGRTADVEIGVRSEDGTQLVSDLRVVSYWLAGGDAAQPFGLARFERKIVTTNGALNLSLPDPETHMDFVIAPEVKSLSFEYFDGIGWTTSWDSNLPGEDMMTPQGPPRAIRITLEIDFSNTIAGAANNPDAVKIFRHVVAINTANGVPMIMLEDPEAVPPEDGGTTTPESTGGTP